MVKPREEKSDDIEIVSIGKLYTGPWDKKYWSSSRGKDRYPYPVGYRSCRIQNAITYNMEILEGLKGPMFTISSTDGNSCSGDTPDIAWENFQKKSCCRVKLWRGKRFSCKVDGVEFYGFKNPFVQRLLRELVANIGGTEQNILTSDSTSRDPIINKLETVESHPDLLPSSLKKPVTGKRRRSGKAVNTKQLDETPIEPHLCSEFAEEAMAMNSSKKNISESRGGIPSIIARKAAVMEVNRKCFSVAETGMLLDPMDMSDHLMVVAPLSAQKCENTISSQQTALDVKICPVNQESSDGPLSEEMNGAINLEQGRPLIDENLCAPDTMDHVGGGTHWMNGFPYNSLNTCSPDKHEQITSDAKDANVNNVSKSDTAMTEEEMGTSDSFTFSEKCDSDPAGQEMTNSMMALLLPRAIPLLKTFSRKKKKKNPSPLSLSIHGDQKKNDMPNCNTHDLAAGELAEQPELERHKERPRVSYISYDSTVSTSGCIGSVVPDSAEYDGPKDPLPSTLKVHKVSDVSVVSTSGCTGSVVPDSFESDGHRDTLPYTFKADKVSDGLDVPSQLHLGTNGKGTTLPYLGGTKEKEISLQEEPQNYLGEQPHKDTILVLEKETNGKSNSEQRNCKSTEETHKIPASTGKCSPSSKNVTCRNPKDLEFPEINGVGLANKFPNNPGLADGISMPNLQHSSTANFQNVSINYQKKDCSRLSIQPSSRVKGSGGILVDLFACHVFPMPISMVQMIVVEDALYICVNFGALEHKESTVFVYMVPERGQNPGCPSLIGYVPVGLETSKDDLNGDIAVDSSLLQFTPDAQLLVLANNVRTPYCREGKLDCLCSACASGCFKNAVKIVQLNSGYVSLVTRLETTQKVRCLLVCTPCFVLAAEEGGKLKLWVMNSSWSAKIKDWYLPMLDCMFPCLVELQRIPLSDNLVIGHNGFGEFGLWDIFKHTLVSRFSSPNMSVSRCISCGIFRWQKRGEPKTEELIVDEIMHATKKSFKGESENSIFPDGKDVGIWLLISTVSDPDSQFYQSSEQQEKPAECWRLALLVNDTVITGSVLDQGVAAVTPAGCGIIGTSDGLVYTWELSTGKKLGNLHSFKGSRVSCLTTDTSNSGAVAVASGGQLLIYLPS